MLHVPKAQYYHRTNLLLFQEKISVFIQRNPQTPPIQIFWRRGLWVLMIRRISQSFRSELLFIFVFLSAAEFESKSACTKRCNCHAYPSPDVGHIAGLCIIALLGSRCIGYIAACKRSRGCFRCAGRGLRSEEPTSTSQLDASNDAGETPLLVACGRGNLHIARMLIEAGADVNRPLPGGSVPLHRAAQVGNRFLTEALLGAGAAIDVRNGIGETALLLAARAGNNEVVRQLVEHHAEVNAADNLQHTALYYAGEQGFMEIVELLLTAGAEG